MQKPQETGLKGKMLRRPAAIPRVEANAKL